MRCLNKLIVGLFVVLIAASQVSADGVLTPAGGSSNALPPGGTIGDCVLNTAPGAGDWQACPGAAGGDSVTVNGAATTDPDFATTGSDLTLTNTSNVITFTLKEGLTVTNWTMVNPALGTPASGVATNLTGTAAGLTAGVATVANSGDSATSFFSSGTIEDARLPSSMADKIFTGSLNIPNAAAPTTDAFGEIAGDNNAWAASRGTIQFFDGTANTYAVNVLASDAPANGECPKWNTGGTITWEACGGSGDVATDAIWDAAGDLVQGTGSNTAARLAIGTANQLLQVNAGATASEWTSALLGLTSISFGANPADAGRLRLSNNESICWEAATPGTDLCLTLNASDEFEINAPLNLTGAAGPLLLTGVTSPSAPGTAEQWYFYADSADNLPKYIYNGESEQTFYTTANPQTTISGNAGTATALAANGTNCGVGEYARGVDASGNAENCTTAAGSGTVTNTGGNLTSNAVVLGAGTVDTKVVAGIITDGTSKVTLGVAGTSVGSVDFKNATSGTVTLAPVTGALGTVTLSLPAATDTLTGKATTDILTNKTIDAEGAGNVLTIPRRLWFPAAGCNNATAGSIWDLPTSNPAVAACVTGTNTQKGVLNFADSANLSAQITYALPTTWTGTVDARIKWYTSATSGDVVWQLSTICVADAETDDPAFNTASTVTDTAKGTTLQTNDAAITTVTVTGCAAGELLHVKIQRDSAHASDSLAATASLIGVELVIREAM